MVYSIESKIKLEQSQEKTWELISTPEILESVHPFCKENKVLFWKENHIKCDIAVGRGKKLRDQREDIKKRDWERDQGRILKNAKK